MLPKRTTGILRYRRGSGQRRAHHFYSGMSFNSDALLGLGFEVLSNINHDYLAATVATQLRPQIPFRCLDMTTAPLAQMEWAEIVAIDTECTAQSYANGVKQASRYYDYDIFGQAMDTAKHRQSRATLLDIARMAEEMHPLVIAGENVVEIVDDPNWPLVRTRLQSEGYCVYLVSVNAAYCNRVVAGTEDVPQSRDRVMIMAVDEGLPQPDLSVTSLCWCSWCEREVLALQTWKLHTKRSRKGAGKYNSDYFFACPECGRRAVPFIRPARSAINFDLLTTRIGDRAALGKAPLNPKTMRRIEEGHRIHILGGDEAAYLVEMTRTGTAYPLVAPLHTIRTSGQHHLLVQRSDAGFVYSSYRHGQVLSLDDRLPTIPTRDQLAVALAPRQGFVIYQNTRDDAHSALDEPFGVIPRRNRLMLADAGDVASIRVEDLGTRYLTAEELWDGQGGDPRHKQKLRSIEINVKEELAWQERMNIPPEERRKGRKPNNTDQVTWERGYRKIAEDELKDLIGRGSPPRMTATVIEQAISTLYT